MLSTLIKKEIIETILGLRFVIATLLCLVLIPLGMYVSIKDYEQRLGDYNTAIQQYEQRAGGIGTREEILGPKAIAPRRR
jgi:hypothetical protein